MLTSLDQTQSIKIVNTASDLNKGWKLLSLEPKLADGKNNPFFINPKSKDVVCIISEPSIQPDVSGKKAEDSIYIIVPSAYIKNDKIRNLKGKLSQVAKRVSIKAAKNKDVIQGIYEDWERLLRIESNKADSEVVNRVKDIFRYAAQKGTSDIHFEVRETGFNIRMRINGSLKLYDDTISPDDGEAFGSVIYQVLTKASDINFNPKNTQDALVDTEIDGEQFRARLATAPANPAGFDMVMRLLKIEAPDKPLTLKQLGYQKFEAEKIKFATSKAVGLVMIAGTTGSGKSTTLQHVLLTKILERDGDIKVITVEDPPEYYIPGATQIPVTRGDSDEETAKQFNAAMRAAMRLDPEIIMIGEVRDKTSAQTLIKAVQSGHKVFSTTHASSAFGIINRLNNLGVPRDILGSSDFISGLIYQKLLPTVCDGCAKTIENGVLPSRFSLEKILTRKKILSLNELGDYKKALIESGYESNIVRYLQDNGVLTPEIANDVFLEFDKLNDSLESAKLLSRIKTVCDIEVANILFKGDGCSKCSGTGVSGRTVVAEVIVPDLTMLDYINKNMDLELLLYWRKTLGGKFAIEDAYEKMKEGIVDPIDIENELAPIGSRIV